MESWRRLEGPRIRRKYYHSVTRTSEAIEDYTVIEDCSYPLGHQVFQAIAV
jgi:hypothetical protein